MKLYDTITKNSLIHEMDRICGSNSTKYPFRDKVSRLNNALDFYFQLAWSVNKVRPLDDSNNSSIPLEEINLVSGTNYYKIGDFTNKFTGIIEVSLLNSDATPASLTREYLHNLPGIFEELYGAYAVANTTGVPGYYCIVGDYIYLRPCPDYNETSGLKVYGNLAGSKFNFLRTTVTQADPGVFTTSSAHGMAVNDMVLFETNDTIPTGITADTVYYIKTVPSDTTFTIASTFEGTAVEITANQATGEHISIDCSKEPGIAYIDDHFNYLARKASLPFLVEKKLPQKNDIVSLIKNDEMSIKEYFGNKDTDIDQRITFKQRAYE